MLSLLLKTAPRGSQSVDVCSHHFKTYSLLRFNIHFLAVWKFDRLSANTLLLLPVPPPKEKEKLYVELKHILARQPGPEAAEQLQQCQWTVRERTKKLKVGVSHSPHLHRLMFYLVRSFYQMKSVL